MHSEAKRTDRQVHSTALSSVFVSGPSKRRCHPLVLPAFPDSLGSMSLGLLPVRTTMKTNHDSSLADSSGPPSEQLHQTEQIFEYDHSLVFQVLFHCQVFTCSPGWPETHDCPASTSQVPGIQPCATTLALTEILKGVYGFFSA